MCRLDRELNFSPWRGGGRHLGLFASIPMHPGWRTPAASTKHPPGPTYNRAALDHAVRHALPSVDSLRQRLRETMAGKSWDIDQINQVLLCLCQEFFPATVVKSSPRPWQTTEIQTSVKYMWESRQAVQRFRLHLKPLLGQVLQAWKLFRNFYSSYKSLRARGKQANEGC